jgi:hypothetical protein
MPQCQKPGFPENWAKIQNETLIAKLEVFTAEKSQVEVFWVVTPFSAVVGYERFLKMESTGTSETLVSYRNIIWRHPEHGCSMDLRNVSILPQHYMASPWTWMQHGSPKRRYPTATLYGVTLKMEAAWTSKTLVSYRNSIWHHPEDGGSMDLRNVGILPQHCTASLSRRIRL